MVGLTSLYRECQRIQKSIALHNESLSKMFKEKKKVDKRARELRTMIERREAKKSDREEELIYVELDIERMETHEQGRKAEMGGLLPGQPRQARQGGNALGQIQGRVPSTATTDS